jgi:hypothetical protein
MSKNSVKDIQASTIVMGALRELINNRNYAYISAESPSFSHLESGGKEFVIALVEAVLPLLVAAHTEQIRQAAEEMMLNKLSK